jgi:hypothetical protein
VTRWTHALSSDERGVAYVEFLLAFIPFFTMFLGMMQMALYFSAGLLVRHAASTAARAAVVVLPDDPQYYDDEEVNRIDEDDSATGSATRVLSLTIPTSAPSRLDAIRTAASIPLLPIAPSYDQLVHDPTVIAAVGESDDRLVTGATLYNRTAVAVTFPTEPGGSSFRETFDVRGRVTVRVTYLFHCGIPVVSKLLCDDYAALRGGVPREATAELVEALRSGDEDRIRAAQERYDHTVERIEREQPGLDELAHTAAPHAGIAYSAYGARFRIIRAEATMTNQGAGFTYAD